MNNESFVVSLARREPHLITILSERQNHRCCYCTLVMFLPHEAHNHANMATIEHVLPKFHGGTDEDGNLAAACRRCNALRRTLNYISFMRALAVIFTRYPTAKARWHDDQFEETKEWQYIKDGIKRLQTIESKKRRQKR